MVRQHSSSTKTTKTRNMLLRARGVLNEMKSGSAAYPWPAAPNSILQRSIDTDADLIWEITNFAFVPRSA